jgi:dihydroorotase
MRLQLRLKIEPGRPSLHLPIASFFGADFYRLPRNRGKVTLVREPTDVPATLPFGDTTIVPLRAGERLAWRLL